MTMHTDKLVKFVKDWMLPLAIVLGVSSYLIFHFCHALHPIGETCRKIASNSQTFLIGVMIFLQMVKMSPREMRFHRWHIGPLLLQTVSFLVLALIAVYTPKGTGRILLECAMLCLICPTASAAGVITDKLGGSLPGNMSYLVMINTIVTFLIPAVVPVIHPSDMPFWTIVSVIAVRIFPMLLLPCFIAWIIRYMFPRLQAWLLRYAHWSFYFWGISLTLAMILATRSLVWSGLSFWALVLIGVVSLACCALQFAFGRLNGRRFGKKDMITSGQALGQKNTGFLIWLGYSYMTPVTSIAGGLYAIWQNIFNSWELYCKRREDAAAK